MRVNRWSDLLYPTEEQRDPTATFRRQVRRVAASAAVAVEIGAGTGQLNTHDARSDAHHLVGIDLSPRIRGNPLLDSAVLGDATRTPFRSEAFDLAFSIYVLEHVADALGFCREMARILKPGGTFLALTPNQHHYVSAISKFTPHSFHQWFNRRSTSQSDDDIFPTYYHLNTRRKLAACLTAAGFVDVHFEMVEVRPNYLSWSAPSFWAGVAYERLVNSTARLEEFRVNIIASARRQ